MHNGAQRIAFDSHNGLGLCKIKYFAAQYPTPHDCCVRFAAVVTGDHATLARGRLATALPSPDFHRLESASFAWRTVDVLSTHAGAPAEIVDGKFVDTTHGLTEPIAEYAMLPTP